MVPVWLNDVKYTVYCIQYTVLYSVYCTVEVAWIFGEMFTAMKRHVINKKTSGLSRKNVKSKSQQATLDLSLS
jgi:hypothetical protein